MREVTSASPSTASYCKRVSASLSRNMNWKPAWRLCVSFFFEMLCAPAVVYVNVPRCDCVQVFSDNGRPWCVCRGLNRGFMVGCEYCDNWFHGPCVGVSPEIMGQAGASATATVPDTSAADGAAASTSDAVAAPSDSDAAMVGPSASDATVSEPCEPADEEAAAATAVVRPPQKRGKKGRVPENSVSAVSACAAL